MMESLAREYERQAAPATASWTAMPNKDQLAVLVFSRLVDFWQMASLQSYMIHQLRSFDPALPDSTISHQAGMLQGSFTAAQIITSVLWGRAADVPSFGRKNVLLVGLIGTSVSCIGVGFASTYWQAAIWRLVGGAINGTVGAARTMVAETVDKKFHSRAFLLLPLAFNVANILGPIVGGLLVDPAVSFPTAFGPHSLFGGEAGVIWMIEYPYALPSLLCAALLFLEAVAVALLLRETLPTQKHTRWQDSYMVEMTKGIISVLTSRRYQGYTPFGSSQLPSLVERDSISMSPVVEYSNEKNPAAKPLQRLPFHRIWTSTVLFTLLSIAIFDFHMGAFSSLWVIFLSTSRTDTEKRDPFHFTGGLAFKPAAIGVALAILGSVGLSLQLILYPWANGRFGLMRCFRYSLFLFPMAYFLAPYISLLPSSTRAPSPASGFLIWLGISLVLIFQVVARTFALPASIILLNNSSPHPSVLATIHGIGQSVSSTFRTVGPIASGYWYGIGLQKGTVGLAWWIVAAISAMGCVASFWVRNGSGHEIILSGEEECEEP
ncbi:MFS general substrate transporter [Lepidopterella palustris CBS 459.81]|uniref:MFS general substrate transporter n=1 Tax=Lepidopterella palustris CBS 459.81 TaxID=1314670 RepID=A0A8E2DYT9_9PEZI|nr:MFS general substrate transporter [Lepidopterella palustris CBS 459.81]